RNWRDLSHWNGGRVDQRSDRRGGVLAKITVAEWRLNMPVVGSSAYNTAGQITSLVRSLLNDAQGNLFTDAVLLPYVNSAYRKVQRAMGNAGAGGFIPDDVLLGGPAVAQTDTSLQVSITD